VVGSGILVLPVLSLEAAGAVASLYAWLLMGLIGLPLVLIFYKMSSASRFTLTGCFRNAFGEEAVFGAKLTVLGALLCGMPAMVYATAALALHFSGIGGISAGFLSHLIITLLCLNQLRPLRQSSKISIYSAFLLVFLMAVSIGLHLSDLKIGLDMVRHTLPPINHSLFRACTLTFFGYVGWESLSFFGDELKDPKKDLKWIYGGSFVLVSVLYLALSTVISGAASQGQKFGIQEGFLSLIPAGRVHALSCLATLILLLANLNAWVFGGTKQTQDLLLKSSKGKAVLYYYLAVSFLILLLELRVIDLSTLFLLSNQCWIVIYGGILAYYFKNFTAPSHRLLGVFGTIGFFLLLMGCSKLILLNIALFAISKSSLLSKLSRRSPAGSSTFSISLSSSRRASRSNY
jgi:amino acid transporter